MLRSKTWGERKLTYRIGGRKSCGEDRGNMAKAEPNTGAVDKNLGSTVATIVGRHIC